MCGRYTITKPVFKTEKIVKKVISVENDDNYNAHPQQKLPVIKQYVNGKTLERLEWGLTPSWAKEKNIRPLINARLETLGEKISFKNLIKSYRCLIVAGIYKTKQFCIVTREATLNVGDIHDRQPVIIDKKDLNHYLDLKNDGVDFLNSYKAPELKFHPVSKDVNIPINNNENLILPK